MGERPFAQGGDLESVRPSAALVTVLDRVSGPARACDGLTDDEVIGVLGRWAAVASWAASGKLRVLITLLRRWGIPQAGTRAGGLPAAWREELVAEVMAALALSRQGADKLIDLAWSLAARLPRTAEALEEGLIDELKAKIIVENTAVLTDEAAATADVFLAGQLAGKTPGEIGRLAQQAAVVADPDAAQARREAAEKAAQVQTWRESTGTMAMAASGLNPATALLAEQAVQDRADAYRKAGIEGDADQLRARAFTDKLLGSNPLGDDAEVHGLRARINLTIPYLTAAGLVSNPGEAGGFGVIDAGLARQLARAAAVAGDATEWHLTIVHDDQKYAVAHACPRRGRRSKTAQPDQTPASADGPFWPATADDAETAENLGTAVLTLPGGQTISGQIHPVPVTTCDHRYETDRHDPSPLLRHLVEVRDGTCTFMGCSTPALKCDFEHSVAWHKGGKTCACMCGARCRFCHQVKQSPGWDVVQILPGFHEWHARSGRSYLCGPKRYPA